MRAQLIIMLSVVWLASALNTLPGQTAPDSLVVYSNSFEIPEDTSGWFGLSPGMFVEDPAPGQGARSLLIGGGCVMPTAWIDIPCTTGVATFRLSFWGNAGLVTPYGGEIVLSPADRHVPRDEMLEVFTDSLDWTFYQAEVDLHLENIDTIRIQIWVGGIVYDDVQIDGLEVVAWPLLATESAGVQPEIFTLHPAYPNPFNPSTMLQYTLVAPGQVALRIYDLMGREVASLVDGFQPTGDYELQFDAGSLPSGVYVARLITPGAARSIKLMLLK